MKLDQIVSKIMGVFNDVITTTAELSWKGLIVMLCIGGVLYMFGNEHGAKATCKKACYGFLVIQLASMLV